ncbi:MAG: ABC transporter ATP-binding protein, partial [Flavobacteriia bacterium]|nr:ABC transporter ATP-binding protein [Flavobacteriia bacterium]
MEPNLGLCHCDHQPCHRIFLVCSKIHCRRLNGRSGKRLTQLHRIIRKNVVASVEFKHVEKVYSGDVHTVKDFNLKINDGEFIVFLGPSGCGKSTTLRMLAGLEDISGGEILINNKVVNELEPIERDIAMVFQSYALYP